MSTTDLAPITGEIELTEHGRTLFATDDPVEVLDHARRVSAGLKTVLDEGGLTMRIGRSEHVLIDGWTTLGAMLGVSGHTVWSRPLENGRGFEARVEARTVDGRVVGSAEAEVSRDERNWRRSDDYALRSMAQTRALSKALRGPLGFVIALAGRNPTPAEEMPAEPVVLPEWAAGVSDEAVDRFERNLAAILEYAGVTEVVPTVVETARTIFAYCDDTLPAVAARLAHLMREAINDTVPAAAAPEAELEPEPELASATPAAAAAPDTGLDADGDSPADAEDN